jgi:hypothetical protein
VESLFEPSIATGQIDVAQEGLTQALHWAYWRSDLDVRATVCSNILLAGRSPLHLLPLPATLARACVCVCVADSETRLVHRRDDQVCRQSTAGWLTLLARCGARVLMRSLCFDDLCRIRRQGDCGAARGGQPGHPVARHRPPGARQVSLSLLHPVRTLGGCSHGRFHSVRARVQPNTVVGGCICHWRSGGLDQPRAVRGARYTRQRTIWPHSAAHVDEQGLMVRCIHRPWHRSQMPVT